MLAQQYKGAVEELKDLFAHFENEVSRKPPLFDPPLRAPLVTRALRAIDEGIHALESEQSRWLPAAPVPENWSEDVFLLHTLQHELDRGENPTLRWLLVAHWVVLGDFDSISANLEPLAASNLDELTWLVAGALWVQWGSGQPTTAQLRRALLRLRARCPQFDAHVAAVLAGPPGADQQAAVIIHDLLADPSAKLPEPASAGAKGA